MFPEPQRLVSSVTGAIFAGGSSRRMGQPKEGLRLWDNRPMIEHVMDALAPLCQQIVIVGQCVGYDVPARHSAGPSIVHIPDRHPGLGPVAALDALLASGLATHYLVTTCDQPLLQPELLKLLLNQSEAEQPVFFRAQDGSELDPFPGLYPDSMLSVVQQALADGHYAIRPPVRQASIQWVTLPEEQKVCLSNLNTPDAVAHLTLARNATKEAVR